MTSLPSSEAPTRLASGKIWQVGTLTYTTGGLVILFCWLLWGDFAWYMRDRSIPSVLQILFTRYGASDTLNGFLMTSLPAGIGAILGPIIGYKSDRLRSRWGRRIPFLVLPTPFIVLSMVGLAFSPRLGAWISHFFGYSSNKVNATILLCMGLSWATFEVSCIIANSVFGALINDVVPHAVIGRFFGLFRAFSLLAGIFVNYWIMGKAEEHYIPICLGIALVYGVGFTLMCLKVKEGNYPPPPEPPEKAGGLVSAVQTYFRDSLGHSYYRWFFATSILCNISTLPFNLYCFFYAKSIGMNIEIYFKYVAVAFMVSLCLAYPLGVLVDRFHPLRISLFVIGLYGIAMACGMFFVKDVTSFAAIMMIHNILSGTYYTASASLSQKLLPQAKFAEIASAGSVLNSVAFIALPLLLGMALDHAHHNYRYIFPTSLGLVVVGVFAGLVLYRKFQALGGLENYIAPE